ncbi:4Fe-4S binding protein [Clostridium sp. AM58-1XD]|uniref:4Fe-4S binding protein n=1 Tax=Clostridium sp. AM58-1XD TaxID=2292307 RepID=UPI000E47D162|nr:4Fe-4S binding protein [Clostridium sp. AM58-1XD]RGY96752.1 4Fe-4S binding protein [Clostridium sp. AM58-1XD]
MKNRKKHWYEYLWIASLIYLVLGFVNILFAWAGLICFFVPLMFAVVKGNKHYCNRYCGRGQLLEVLGNRLGLSRKKDIPAFVKSRWFRYGFLAFFLIMFVNMLFTTYLVSAGQSNMRAVVKVLWTIRFPWDFAYHGTVIAPWVAQFAFGFYSVMLTSTILGLLTMILFKPRSWCVYCPMGTMTQGICMLKHRGTRE